MYDADDAINYNIAFVMWMIVYMYYMVFGADVLMLLPLLASVPCVNENAIIVISYQWHNLTKNVMLHL